MKRECSATYKNAAHIAAVDAGMEKVPVNIQLNFSLLLG
jgi:hypothetical protein